MDMSKIVAEIDAEIASLQHARAVLLDLNDETIESKPRRGRPRGTAKTSKTIETIKIAKPSKRKRTLSPEGRSAIAEAMKRRWAERRKQQSASTKKTAPVKKQATAVVAK
ncbi:MAG: hypothetical protein HIU91_12415 [Acidobacteria bacterium]|nr:hypothetical protein [Acidobacteriota bacterium]